MLCVINVIGSEFPKNPILVASVKFSEVTITVWILLFREVVKLLGGNISPGVSQIICDGTGPTLLNSNSHERRFHLLKISKQLVVSQTLPSV
jgi:hypothetical protein